MPGFDVEVSCPACGAAFEVQQIQSRVGIVRFQGLQSDGIVIETDARGKDSGAIADGALRIRFLIKISVFEIPAVPIDGKRDNGRSDGIPR